MDVQIRVAEVADLTAIHAIRRAAILAVENYYSSTETEEWAERRPPVYFLPRIRTGQVLLAVHVNRPVGWVSIDGNKVTGLYVLPEAGGSGIGTTLMHEAENRISKAGFDSCHLAASKNAVGFYERAGYKATAVHEGGTQAMIKHFANNAAPSD